MAGHDGWIEPTKFTDKYRILEKRVNRIERAVGNASLIREIIEEQKGIVTDVEEVTETVEEVVESVEEIAGEVEAIIVTSVRVYRQPEPPVPGVDNVPDPLPEFAVWFDTDDDNKQYSWNPETLVWEETAAVILGEQYDALVADMITVFRQPGAPVPGVDDVPDPIPDKAFWYDTDDGNRPYIWNPATSEWESTDASIIEIIESLGAGVAVFRQDEPPTAGVGGVPSPIPPSAIWFDTNDGNRPYSWNATTSTWESTDAAILAAVSEQVDDLFPIDGTQITDDSISTEKLAANAITAKHTITGAKIQTVVTDFRGVKLTSGGIVAYDSAGNPTFTVNAADGVVTTTGALLTGGTVSGATVNGGVIQTSQTPGVGVKITSAGIVGYGAGGSVAFSVSASSGVLQTAGGLLTGGSIDGATVTGGVVQTTATPSRGVKITSGGIVAYNNSGTATFTVNGTTGQMSASGGSFSGNISASTIDSQSTITGATIRTSANLAGSIVLDGSSFRAYNGNGDLSFNIAGGQIYMTGDIIVTGISGNPGSLRAPSIYASGETGSGFAPALLSSEGRIARLTSTLTTPGAIIANGSVTGTAIKQSVDTVTTSVTANTYVNATSGFFSRVGSSARYKKNIKPATFDFEAMLRLQPHTYQPKNPLEGEDPNSTYIGFIAEEAADLGLEDFVERNEKGEPDSFSYMAFGAVAHHALIQNICKRLDALERRSGISVGVKLP